MYKKNRILALASVASEALVASAGIVADSAPTSQINEARQENRVLTTYMAGSHFHARQLMAITDGRMATPSGKMNERIPASLTGETSTSAEWIQKEGRPMDAGPEPSPSNSSVNRHYSQVVTNATITAAAKSTLLWSQRVQGLFINVETKSGRVTSHGPVPGRKSKETADRLAFKTHNMNKVNNTLKANKRESTISRVISDTTLNLGRIISDSWVTTKVKLALMFSTNVNSAHIFIKTRNGVVTLAGNVPTETEHGLAIEIANQVHGVNSVNARNLAFPNEFQQFTIHDPANGLFLF